MVLSPREPRAAALSLRQLAGPDSVRPPHDAGLVESAAGNQSAALRRLTPSSVTPRGAAALHKQQLAHGASQLAHLKSESRREGLRRAAAARGERDSNQLEDGEAAFASRRSASSAGLELSTGLDASFASSEPSPVDAVMEFLDRDVEEEERAMRAKSDKEKAFLYKLRYTDLYDYTVALAKQVLKLEDIRSFKNEEIELLRSKVSTQATIIDTMSDPAHSFDSSEHRQEKRVQALCREVAMLVRQLKDRDSVIEQLKDECAFPLSELKTSGTSPDSKASSVVDSSTVSMSDYTALEMSLEAAQREKNDAKREISVLTKKLVELERHFHSSEAKRAALEDGLEGAEEQLNVIQFQWEEEKKELKKAAANNTKHSSSLTAECERLRAENEALQRKMIESKLDFDAREEASKKALEQAESLNTCLQAQIQQMEVQMDDVYAKDRKIDSLELELLEIKQKLERTEFQVRSLQKDVASRETDLFSEQLKHKKEISKFELRLLDAEIVRRSLHNQVMELKGNIRVFCRVRPIMRHERLRADYDQSSVFAFPDYKRERRQIELHASPTSHTGYGQNTSKDTIKKYNFNFDMVFDGGSTQEELFLEVSALVQSALDGYNVCIFAYGQTGSGKTYTMQGPDDSTLAVSVDQSPHMGIVGRTIARIFDKMVDLRLSGWEFTASLEMIEIYNETLRDLLAPSGSTDKVDLRMGSNGKPVVTNSVSHEVSNEQEAWSLLQRALSRRSTKATNMNDQSSRSHCVITFRLSGANSLTGDARVGVVNLVDLAGSERLSKSGSDADPELMKEAMAINKSLSSLGNVVSALARKSRHIPYRDSKLTHLLSPSLGGDCKTLMICNLSPHGENRDETLNSLRFAQKVNSCEVAYASISSR